MFPKNRSILFSVNHRAARWRPGLSCVLFRMYLFLARNQRGTSTYTFWGGTTTPIFNSGQLQVRRNLPLSPTRVCARFGLSPPLLARHSKTFSSRVILELLHTRHNSKITTQQTRDKQQQQQQQNHPPTDRSRNGVHRSAFARRYYYYCPRHLKPNDKNYAAFFWKINIIPYTRYGVEPSLRPNVLLLLLGFVPLTSCSKFSK